MIKQLSEAYEIQKGFRDRMEAQGNATTIENLVSALLVEMYEWYNETATFKTWKKKQPLEAAVTEENADILAFTIELAIALGVSADEYSGIVMTGGQGVQLAALHKGNVVDLFTDVALRVRKMLEADRTTHIGELYFKTSLIYVMSLPFSIALSRGTSAKKLLKCYRNKMEINHRRQDKGY